MNSAAGITVTDARGRHVTLPHAPKRIVSLVPSQTELLASLGLEDRVVGVTRFCIRPEQWKTEKRIVGGTKSIRHDRIRQLRPDLILANLEENTREDVHQLDETAPVYVTNVSNLEDALAMIEAVARLTDRADAGRELTQAVRRGFDQLGDFKPLRTAYLIWNGPYMTVGTDTFIHDIMTRAGFTNSFSRSARYPVVDEAQMIDANVEVVLLPSEPFPFSEDHVATFEGMLPHARIQLVDGQLFSWYGSRLLHTPGYLRRLRADIDGS